MKTIAVLCILLLAMVGCKRNPIDAFTSVASAAKLPGQSAETPVADEHETHAEDNAQPHDNPFSIRQILFHRIL